MAITTETVKVRTRPLIRPEGFDSRAAVQAGIWGGVVFWVLRSMLTIPSEPSWEAARRFCSLFMREGLLPYPGAFNPVYALAAIPALCLAVIYAAIIGDIVHARRAGAPTLGGVCGLALYGVNYYLFTGIFPALAAGRHWTTALCYLVFGAATAGLYKGLAARRREGPWALRQSEAKSQ